MDKNIDKIKKLFIIGALVLALAITGGSYLFKDSTLFSAKNMMRNASFIKYKMLFFGVNLHPSEQNAQANVIPIFVYHGIVKRPDRFSMTQKTFAEQMKILKKNGYQTISIQDLYDYMYTGKILPEKSFLLTFDDGRKDSYYGADSILRALGYKAVMFTATGVSLPTDTTKEKSSYYLNENEVRQMQDSGRWEIESHAVQINGGLVTIDAAGTQDNFLSNKAWLPDQNRLETDDEYKKRVGDEIINSKKTIDEQLNKTAIAISYPFGDFGQQSTNITHQYAQDFIHKTVAENYKLAFRQIWPTDHEFSQNTAKDNPYFLKRIEPSPAWTKDYFINLVLSGQTKKMPFSDDFIDNTSWRNVWGDMSVSNNMLHTHASTTTTGSFNILDGTAPWKNYVYTAKMNWENGSHVSLIARYQDSENYINCTLSDGQARIEQRINGKITKLAETKIGFSFSKTDLPLSISVFGNKAKCFIGDKKVADTYNLNTSLSYGGIGFKTWDEEVGVSDVSISLVSVKELASNTIVSELLKEF
jgi:peptidoglycan/xylan/chitin deacetylase (PgdA/CDA1 family)